MAFKIPSSLSAKKCHVVRYLFQVSLFNKKTAVLFVEEKSDFEQWFRVSVACCFTFLDDCLWWYSRSFLSGFICMWCELYICWWCHACIIYIICIKFIKLVLYMMVTIWSLSIGSLRGTKEKTNQVVNGKMKRILLNFVRIVLLEASFFGGKNGCLWKLNKYTFLGLFFFYLSGLCSRWIKQIFFKTNI